MDGEGSQKAPPDGTVALQTCQQIARAVRDDIKHVLASSWELQQLNHTAPKANKLAINKLAVPKRARVQQQVTHNLHDVSDFAKWKSAQLSKQRMAREANEAEQQMEQAAQREALEGWHRDREQLGRQLCKLHQQQVMEHEQQAKITTAAVTERAKRDLQLLKEKQEQKKLHAAELHAQITKQRMDTRVK